MNEVLPIEKVRIDRWLWAARFYKTRSLAKTAIESGKIAVNDQRTKASKEISIDDQLSIRRGDSIQIIIVRCLTDKRGSAKIAQALYEETEQSRLEREIIAEKRKIARAGYSSPTNKPSKKDRRKITELKMHGEN